MRREVTLALLLALGASAAAAQSTEPPATTLRAGVGLSSTDHTCSGCSVDVEGGYDVLAAGSHAVGRLRTLVS
jgi:hypothetical protein